MFLYLATYPHVHLDIDVGDVDPIHQRFYRVPPNTRNHISAEIQYMLHHDIVWPSFSSWASPCLLVNIQMDLTGFVLITVRQIK